MSVRDAILLHSGLVLYAAAAALLFAAVRRGSAPLLSAGRAGLLAAAAAHGSLFLLRGHFPPASLFEFALLLEVALTAVALAIDLAGKMPILSVGCAPTALAFGLVAALVGGPAGPRPEKVAGSSAALHVGVSLAAFGAFALAFVCGLLYLFERRQLKGRAAAPILGFMPSLEALYRLMFASVLAGVLCLTAGVLVGYMYARTVETASNAWRTDPKVILTTVTWLAYLLVALSSFLPAFRGRRAAQASVACFAFVILAFWATAFSSRFHGFR